LRRGRCRRGNRSLTCRGGWDSVEDKSVPVAVDRHTGRSGETRDGVEVAQKVEQRRRRPCGAVVGQVVAEVVHRGTGCRGARNGGQPTEGVDASQVCPRRPVETDRISVEIVHGDTGSGRRAGNRREDEVERVHRLRGRPGRPVERHRFARVVDGYAERARRTGDRTEQSRRVHERRRRPARPVERDRLPRVVDGCTERDRRTGNGTEQSGGVDERRRRPARPVVRDRLAGVVDGDTERTRRARHRTGHPRGVDGRGG
jgi:hypothetical protein